MDGSTEELVSLSELGAGADMGLTGRPVFAGDGTLLGVVADVLGGARGEGPRYVAILLEAQVARMQGGKKVFVPFTSARVDDSGRVHLDTVTGESAVTLPIAPTQAPIRDPDATVLDHARAVDSLGAAAAPAGTRELAGKEERVVLSEEQLWGRARSRPVRWWCTRRWRSTSSASPSPCSATRWTWSAVPFPPAPAWSRAPRAT
jgi:hypothetical protein